MGSGYWDKEGKHRCEKNHLTKYQIMSGGQEYYCPICEMQGFYPKTEKPMIRAQLLATEKGRKQLKKELKKELKHFKKRDK